MGMNSNSTPDYRALCAGWTEYELTRAANSLSNRTANDNHRALWAKDSSQAADRAKAVLRAAAGCVPKEEWGGENYATGLRDGIAFSCQFLCELAAELEVEASTGLRDGIVFSCQFLNELAAELEVEA